ncbi:MAG: hypothetical protein LC658_10880, partial [Bacteroidales bacterium]|nr:hypothetical protein [Bacteroidales bacterium]
LLPALPEIWPSGDVRGLKARGGFEIDLKWENNELTMAEIRSERGEVAKIRYKEKEITLNLKKGKKQTLRLSDF